MKFGYCVRSPTTRTYPEIRDLTIKIERLGFDSVHITDHLLGFDESQDKKETFLEALTILAALAIETKKVKLGQIVLCNSFRNPVYLAKIISTLDHLSNGRALLWIGAGWYEEEYKAYSYPFGTPKRRVDELEESITIFKKVFTEDETSFEGKFWRLESNRSYPKPIQKPYPQIVIGTSGKRMIDIAVREADGINLPYLMDEQRKSFHENISIVHEKLKEYNRDPSKFEISLFTTINIVNSCEGLDEKKNQFIGTPDNIKEKIAEVENLGIKKMVITVESSEFEDPLDVFTRDIV